MRRHRTLTPTFRDVPDPHPHSPALNHPIITKVAWRLTPTVIICYFFASFDRSTLSFAKFQLQDALTLSDTACGLGARLFVIAGAVLLGAGAVLFLFPPGLRAEEWLTPSSKGPPMKPN